MNEKGFTFVELIAIVLILSAICLVSFPTILNMTKKSDKNTYEEYKKTVCLAAKTYVNSNSELIEDKTSIDIQVNDLVSLDYLEEDIVNPKTDVKVVEEDSTVKITVNSDNSLECEYVE